jgi:hypothetical protein
LIADFGSILAGVALLCRHAQFDQANEMSRPLLERLALHGIVVALL